LLGDPHAAVDLHRARIAPLHFRQLGGRHFLFDQRAANATQPEIDGQRQADGTRADHENLSVHPSACLFSRATFGHFA
jgi:hypothetical protein